MKPIDVVLKGFILENGHHKISDVADRRPQYYAISERNQDNNSVTRGHHSLLWPTVKTLERYQKYQSQTKATTVCCHQWPQPPIVIEYCKYVWFTTLRVKALYPGT